ncbi:MAG: SLBB domain-containing protein [Candidatus Margulisbacteria bacterium]|nr:SLBB domain-containing protein [Candidatus Margulisiibacteriota bacterium]
MLGPGDKLDIYIYSIKDNGALEKLYKNKTTDEVSLSGFIELPNLGLVNAQNKSIEDFRQELVKKYTDYFTNPYIVISLVTAKKIPIYVLGQVFYPGVYYVTDSDDAAKKILFLIHEAGGFTEIADKNYITVKRGQQAIPVNLIESLQNNVSSNISLQQEDIVIVNSRVNKVYILGEVKAPGAFTYVEGATLLDYVAQAGGLTQYAGDEIGLISDAKTEKEIQVVKVNPQLRLPVSDVRVNAGSIVFVPKGFIGNWEFILRQMQNLRDTFYYPKNVVDVIRNTNTE